VQPTWTRKAGREYRYYACARKVRTGYEQCPLPTLPAGEIETTVVDQLRILLRPPDVIARTYREVRKAGETGPDAETLARLADLRRRHEQTQSSIRALLDVGDHGEGFLADELKRLSAELKALAKAIRETEAQAAKGEPVELNQVADALRAIDPVWEVLFPEEQRRIVQLLIEKITIHTSGIDIRFRTNGIEQIVHELACSASRLQPIEDRVHA
ncbi:MAG: recombinase zinc beta ribbon domain-containing protein, partial [Phycisphaerae bacterium]